MQLDNCSTTGSHTEPQGPIYRRYSLLISALSASASAISVLSDPDMDSKEQKISLLPTFIFSFDMNKVNFYPDHGLNCFWNT